MGTRTRCSFRRLPDRDDPGEDTSGEAGGERLSRGDGDLLAGDETAGDPGGVSPSIDEKNLRVDVGEEQDSEPSSLPISRFELRDGLSPPSVLAADPSW